MSTKRWIAPIGILVTLFVFNVAASPGGCGGSEPKTTQTTTPSAPAEEPAAPTTQPTSTTTQTDTTKTEPPPVVKPPEPPVTKPPEPVVIPTKALITTNVRNATLEPLPGAPPRFWDWVGSGAFEEALPRRQSSSSKVQGQSLGAQIKSLRAYVLRILICKEEGATVGGSGHQINNAFRNCIILHMDPEQTSKGLSYWENYNGDNAKADDAKFVSVIDPNDLNRLQNIKTELAPCTTTAAPERQTQSGYCNNNGVCEKDKGEYPFVCPGDCPKETTGSTEGTRDDGRTEGSGTGSSCVAGDYVWAIVEDAPAAKINAELTMNDGRTLVTKDGPVILQSGTGTSSVFFTQPDNLAGTPGSSQEMIVRQSLTKGVFRFQKAFTITQADLENKVQFVLDLVLNPEGFLYGQTPADGQEPVRDENGNAITPTPARLAPVPHKVSETVLRETYVLNLPKMDFRLELYSIKEDAAKTIYAVDARPMVTKATDVNVSTNNNIQFFYIGADPDGKLNFQAYNKVAIISGFSRLSAVGTAGTAKVLCADAGGASGSGWSLSGNPGSLESGCASASSTLSVGYTLVGLKEVK
ncbi:MAG: hypothetical protein HYT87_00080 [Nitrospirae bacterium]|nr:hypothetical protein [Nitrospirota bacterium]